MDTSYGFRAPAIHDRRLPPVLHWPLDPHWVDRWREGYGIKAS